MWTCPKCAAQVDDLYASCWSCNADQPVEKSVDDGAAADTSPSTLDPALIRPWTCSKCGIRVDAGFDTCWACGTSIDGVEDPTFVTADEIESTDENDQDDEAPSQPQPTCPRCSGLMVRGFVDDGDSQGPPPERVPLYWVEETIEGSRSTGSERYEVRAYRCYACGYLEFYAGEAE
jgi:hypothetical protein